ncbi:hypothetical protein [Kineococcus terrestris]|uniref:hypothetical protein n=1 Tax=Kineococcus terrestris TaxID=2044856 RepID=UPI0034DB4902
MSARRRRHVLALLVAAVVVGAAVAVGASLRDPAPRGGAPTAGSTTDPGDAAGTRLADEFPGVEATCAPGGTTARVTVAPGALAAGAHRITVEWMDAADAQLATAGADVEVTGDAEAVVDVPGGVAGAAVCRVAAVEPR